MIDWHKAEYDMVRELHPSLPVWEDLNEVQKEKVRDANKEKQKFFQKLGDEIRR